MLAELSRRSDEATRGTALAYFSVAFALGMVLGASGGGLLYPWLGFAGLLLTGSLLCALGVLALLRDRLTMQLVVPVESKPAPTGVG
jgi:predicted MFS family arabinose efflux permease